MTQYNDLLTADAARRTAMINADVDAMNSLFDEDLTWTHSSGRTDGRAALIESICSGGVVYQSIENSDVSVRQHGDIFLLTGVLAGQVLKEGTPKSLHNKFLSVWKRSGNDYGMLAWQSTGV